MAENVQDLIIRYKADISELKGKVEQIEATMSKAGKAGEDAAKKTEDAFKKTGKAADDLQPKTNALSSGFENLGKTIIAAFAVERVIAFGAAAVRAYADSQKAQLQLLGALKGQVDVQQRLIRQADELQGKFGIDNDAIVKQQAFLALQGRTEAQITKTIKAAIQLSAVTGEDLNSSVQKLDATYEGNIGRLGKLDSKFGELTKTQLANGAAIDLVNEKYQGFAEAGAQSVQGQLEIQQRQIDDMTKALGEKLAPAWLNVKQNAVEFLGSITEGFDLFNKNKSILNLANLFGANDAVNVAAENKKTLDDIIAQSHAAFEKLSADRLANIIQGNLKELQENKNLSELQRLNLQGEYLAAAQLLKVKQQSNEADKDNVETLERLKQQLEDLKSAQTKIADPLGLGKGDNAANLKAQADIQAKIDQITGEAAKRASEAAKKAQEEREKAEADAFKRQQDLNKKSADETLEIQLANLETQKQAELGAEERSVQEKLLIDIKYLEERAKLYEDDKVVQAKILAEIEAKKTQIIEQGRKDAIDAAEAVSKQSKEAKDKELKAFEDAEKRKREIIQQSVELIKQSFDIIAEFSRISTDGRIALLEEQRDALLASDDEEIAALENKHQKKQIGEREFEKQSEALRQKRIADEKRMNDEIAKQKQKQAQLEKDLAIFEATINLASAISKAFAQGGPIGGVILAALAAALAGAQLAAIIATPIPKFARGTKGAHGSMSLVGEEGPEFMYVPNGAKILPAQKTKQYSEFIDAMYDNRLNEHLEKMYIGPRLQHQRALLEKRNQENFAQNIANSFMLQKGEGFDEYLFARLLEKGNIKLSKEIGREVGRNLGGNRYSAYTD